MRRVLPVFQHLQRHVRSNYAPDFSTRLREGKMSEFPERRNMAYCLSEPKRGLTIVVAPKMNQAPLHNIEGVLAHDFGHAILFHCGHYDHTEREADKVAESLFGARIRYDRNLIQSTCEGVHPRPEHLG